MQEQEQVHLAKSPSLPRLPLSVVISMNLAETTALVGRFRNTSGDGDRVAREGRMAAGEDRSAKLLKRLDAAWVELEESYAGLPEVRLVEPGVTGDWSVKDILAHVTTWEEEALKHLPLIIEGGRPPRYVTFGGINAFNARVSEQKRGLSLSEVRRQSEETHRRLIGFIESVPAEQLAGDTRARRRLRLDTYGHYPLHAEMIRAWRGQT